MPVYFGSNNNVNNFSPNDLERLRISGINQLVVDGYHPPDFDNIIFAFNTNSILNKFKVVLDIHRPIYDVYYSCLTSSNCSISDLSNHLPQTLTSFLDEIIQIAKNNSVVAGYYTFDEPALPKSAPGIPRWTIDKEFQIAIYNYIRNRDQDILNRPVVLSNTMYDPTLGTLDDATINFSISNDAQDIIFIDQYDDDPETLKNWFTKWKQKNLNKPFVFIYPTYFKDEICYPNNLSNRFDNRIQEALTEVYQNNWPVIKGVGGFAYWPLDKPDFKMGLDNCTSLMEDFCNYLSNLPSGLMAEWRLDQDVNNVGPQGTAASFIGTPTYSDKYYVEGNGSIYFNGNNQGLELSPGNGFLKKSFETRSIVFWMQPFSSSSTQILYEEGDSGNGLAVRLNQGSLQIAVASLGWPGEIFTVPGFVTDQKWYHIGIVYDKGNLKVFVNGEKKSEVSTYSSIGAHWDATGLGVVITDGGIGNTFGANDITSSFNGYFDDVKIYDIALSAEKVNFISQGLFGHWRFNNSFKNEGSGNTDAVVSGNYTNSLPYEGSHALTNKLSNRNGAMLSSWGGYLRAEIKQRTIMFWMKPTAININQMLYEEGDSGNGIAVRINANNNLEVGVTCFGVKYLFSINQLVTANDWHNVTVIFNYGQVAVYLDNHKENFNFAYSVINPHWDGTGFGTTISDGGIGNSFGGTDNTIDFRGVIDDCRIYNSILPESYFKDMCNHCGPITNARLSVSHEQPATQKDEKDVLYISSSNNLFIRSHELIKSYKVLDMSGKSLLFKNIPATYTHTVDISGLPKGVYLMQTAGESGKISTYKFIK